MLLIWWADNPIQAHPTHRKPFSTEELESLLVSLQEEGFSRETLQEIFYDSRLRKVETVVGLNALHEESRRQYEQFLTPYAIRLSRKFRRRHFRELLAVEREYGVSMNVIVAILLVETQFGTARLPFRVMEVFATLVVESRPEALENHYRRLKRQYPGLGREFLASRLGEKGEWAFQELVAFLDMGSDDGTDLLEIKGSYAGAIGMPQFLPTSYHRWGVDGNNDAQVDLENRLDAMASIANYLREHGWKERTGLTTKMRAVWEYNRSPPYVDAIFAISRKLSLPSRKRIARS